MKARMKGLWSLMTVMALTSFGFAQGRQFVATSLDRKVKNPSEQMRALLASPLSDSPDRTYDSWDRVERELARVRTQIGTLRGALAYSSSGDTKAQLDQLTRVEAHLAAFRAGLGTYQERINDLIRWAQHIEDHAAQGTAPDAADLTRFHALGKECADAVGTMKASANALTTAARETNNGRVQRFAEYLGEEATVLDQVITTSGATPAATGRNAVSSVSPKTDTAAH